MEWPWWCPLTLGCVEARWGARRDQRQEQGRGADRSAPLALGPERAGQWANDKWPPRRSVGATLIWSSGAASRCFEEGVACFGRVATVPSTMISSALSSAVRFQNSATGIPFPHYRA